MLFLRDTASGNLLLRLEPSGVTYQYFRSERTLNVVTAEDWEHASDNPSSDCVIQTMITNAPANLHPGHSLKVGDREVETEGMTPLVLRIAPSRQKAAVVSAAGPYTQVMIMLGRKGAIGQFYHEVFSHPDYRLLQKAVRIPIGSKDLVPEACWTPGEKEVVYYDSAQTQLCIVPVEPEP